MVAAPSSLLLRVALLGVVACAGSSGSSSEPAPANLSPAPAEEAAPTGAATANLGILPVLPGLPNRAFLDLGPILIAPGDERTSHSDQLTAIRAAQALQANALVYETRPLAELYPPTDIPQHFLANRPALLSLVEVALHMLPVARMGNPGPATPLVSDPPARGGYYRAIRYIPEPPAPVSVHNAELDAEVAGLLAAEPDLAAQLGRLHQLFAAGYLRPEVYRELRGVLAAPSSEQP